MDFNDKHHSTGFETAAVVPLSSRVKPDQTMTILRQLEHYWRRHCRPDGAPYRSDITASALGPALPYAFLAERVAASTLRVRVAGRQLEQLAGMEVRGLPLSALFTVPARKTLTATIDAMVQRPALIELPLRLDAGLLRRAQQGRLLLLPLRDDAGGLSRVLGAIVLDDRVHGRIPVRLDIPEGEPLRFEPISIQAPIQASMRVVMGADSGAGRGADRGADEKRPGNGRPALRLVVSNG